MHIATLVFWIHTFDELIIEWSTESSDREDRGDTTSEMTRTMCSRKNPDFTIDRTYFVGLSTIETTT
jgi:hypothetical protein